MRRFSGLSVLVAVILTGASATFAANTLSAGGLKGVVRSQSADMLGKGTLQLGGALHYGQEWEYIHSVTPDGRGSKSPRLVSGVGFIGIGLLQNLDLGLNLPAYYDVPNFGSINAKGMGDLELSLKLADYWCNGNDIYTMAYYLALQFPTGNATDGFFPRHAYYGSKGNWSAPNTIIHPMIAGTIHFDRLASKVPLQLTLNFGGTINAPKDNNALTASAGLEYLATKNWTFFTEVSAEERISTVHKDHPMGDLINDPIYVTPGVKYTIPKINLTVTLAGDIGISESDVANAQIGYTETGKTVLHQANPLYNAYFGLSWLIPGKPTIVDTDNDGVVDSLDKCPNEAGLVENSGCPDVDSDNDGIVDRLDKCPNEAEDMDGFEDTDGCPDLDNDGDGVIDTKDKCPNVAGAAANDGCPDTDIDKDGIPDRLDQCPNEAEDKDNFQDDDGCPDYDNDGDGIPDSLDNCPNNPGVAETQGCPKSKEITRAGLVLKGVNFESGKAVLLAGSYKALNEMAESLREWPEINIEIQGHTDNTGSSAKNQTLSQARAESVKQYLTTKGVSEFRLTAIGYGQDKPIADNKTATGRAQNRRVEISRNN